MHATPEIICAGELLMDLISLDYTADFRSADRYQRLPGGSPANLAMNLARLGRRPGLVATVGRDDGGQLLVDEVVAAGVDARHLARVAAPTTLILVTKSRAVSDFEPYRLADVEISAAQFPDEYLAGAKVFHTTAFALSREPARSAILTAAARAVAAGARLSIDANYAAKIWPDREEALRTIGEYLRTCPTGPLIKFSDVDYQRLFAEEASDPPAAARRIRELGGGRGTVCLTRGEDGCFLLDDRETFSLPTRPVAVKDTTGAGDAFWSGFLAGQLEGRSPLECATAGRAMAERKLTTVGPLRRTASVTELLQD